MDSLSKVFFRGLVTLIPIALTIYIVYSAISILENLLGGFLRDALPTYIPGLGLLVIVGLIFAFGLLLNNFLAVRILEFIQQKLSEFPVVKAIYSPLRDLINLFSKKNQKALKSVVLVNYGDSGIKAVGLVTRDSFHDLKLSHHTDGKVAVYIPFSYLLGGITVLVPKEQVTEIDLPIEKAMSLALTGWVKSDSKIGPSQSEDTSNESH